MGLLDQIRSGSYVADNDEEGPRGGARISLADTGRRLAGGTGVLEAVRDFLDQLPRLSQDELALLIQERPEPTGDSRADALFGGIAEHVAVLRRVPCPPWAREEERFLDRFWFVSGVAGFRAVALAQTPVSLKRRGIFWPARSLERV